MKKKLQQLPPPEGSSSQYSETELRQMEIEIDLVKIDQEIKSTELSTIAPTIGAPPISEENIKSIVVRLAHNKFLQPAASLTAIYLLFLKGAASKSARDSIYVQVISKDGRVTKVTKGDLMMVYHQVTNNKLIRRLAESLAVKICKFAETHNISGDLAFVLETEELANEQPPLTEKEKAWANSFCQNIPDLEKHSSPRLQKILNKDYQKRLKKWVFFRNNYCSPRLSPFL